jgi:hypothetical protein
MFPIIWSSQLNKKMGRFSFRTTSVTADTFDPSWSFSDASVMTVDWGDGSANQSHATGISHTYANAGTKEARFTCPDWQKLVTLNLQSDACVNAMPNFGLCTGLKDLRVESNTLTGAIPSFANCTLLEVLHLEDNFFTGYGGGLTTQKNLWYLNLSTTQFPSLLSTEIDAILADLATSLYLSGRVTCTVDLSGTGNGVPSAAGLASKALLDASGWAVTVNGVTGGILEFNDASSSGLLAAIF